MAEALLAQAQQLINHLSLVDQAGLMESHGSGYLVILIACNDEKR